MKIVKYPNKILTTPTVEWDFESGKKEELLECAEKMKDLLKSTHDGVALAANQAGFNIRMFVIAEELANNYSIPSAIINPKIKPVGGDALIEEKEGCLSFPGLFFKIKRHDLIWCEFYDLDGKRLFAALEDFGSRVFQHECEHLDGKLYIDNLSRIEKYQVIGKYKKGR